MSKPSKKLHDSDINTLSKLTTKWNRRLHRIENGNITLLINIFIPAAIDWNMKVGSINATWMTLILTYSHCTKWDRYRAFVAHIVNVTKSKTIFLPHKTHQLQLVPCGKCGNRNFNRNILPRYIWSHLSISLSITYMTETQFAILLSFTLDRIYLFRRAGWSCMKLDCPCSLTLRSVTSGALIVQDMHDSNAIQHIPPYYVRLSIPFFWRIMYIAQSWFSLSSVATLGLICFSRRSK